MPSLRECNTSAEVVALEFDNAHIEGFALYCDGSEVTIISQDTPGEVTVPKKIFDRLLAQYEKQQTSAH